MAKLMLIGDVAKIEILTDPEDEELVLARCMEHVIAPSVPCLWWARYDTIDDATQYAADHADRGDHR